MFLLYLLGYYEKYSFPLFNYYIEEFFLRINLMSLSVLRRTVIKN